MSLVDIVKHALPMKLADGKRHVWPTLASMVYLKDGTTPLADGDGKITSDNALNAAKLGGKAPEYYTNPRNLLDNSDFTNPVNQRGQTTYTGSGIYTIDRWRTYQATGKCTVTKNNGYITLNAVDGTTFLFCQYFPKGYLTADKYTLAYCRGDGSIGVNNNPIISGTSIDYVAISTAGTVDLKWIALYEGTYTTETLPPYVPKGYVAELEECQRYFFQIDTYSPIGNGYSVSSADARIAIVTPVEMRNTPSLNDSFDLTIVGNGVSKTVTSTIVGSKSGNIVRLNIVSSGLTASHVYSAFTGGTGALQLSADL